MKAKGTVHSDPEGPLQGRSFPVDAAALDRLESILNGEFHPATLRSSQVEATITEESAAFFSRQKTAEDVAKLIQNKVTTFLNE